MKVSGDWEGTRIGEGGVIGRGELSSGGGDGDPARSRGEWTSLGRATWGMERRSDDEGEGTFDSITSRGRIRFGKLDSLKGDYDVVGVVGD
jgi:hypothetical protein